MVTSNYPNNIPLGGGGGGGELITVTLQIREWEQRLNIIYMHVLKLIFMPDQNSQTPFPNTVSSIS